ncbi:uncharacterized protein LOC102622688 isoform X3 [Citrus sinensis]|uniref:uncharacterized protein LOC112099293 n=1 Tax=Citrus clementina TaxID=85681 RepID=UPI0003D7214C|nr:uncharacterized protein LOC102622688 isoform X3 [Citrus sinensis]XP_024042398.1 uncharacterized protein LOC112099293 [Citrus x clementina]XP_024957107.1 uncharacterized protein LOC102622688 isoform X3 [Citrus sinensis]XP_024957108.1 uncharacterized protein LOC102622688 isoform X3 [Citrus sinensis]
MGYLVFRLFRFHPPDEEEIINRFLNKKRLDRDFSVQPSKKHTAKCVVYGFHSTYGLFHKVEGQQLPSLDSDNHVAENIRQEVEYEQVTDHIMTYNVEIMLQKAYVPVHGKNCNYYQVTIWFLVLEIMLQKKLKKKIFPEVECQLFQGEPQLLPSHHFHLAL